MLLSEAIRCNSLNSKFASGFESHFILGSGNSPKQDPKQKSCQNRPPQANVVLKITTPSNPLKILSPSKICPKPQAKIKNYASLSKLQKAVVRQNVSLPKQNFFHPKQIRVSISPQAILVACLGP